VITIPEERLTAKLCQLLLEHLGEVLDVIEAEQCDGVRTVNLRRLETECAELPLGELPSAVIAVKKGELSEKDRILKNEIYMLSVTIGYAGRDLAKQGYRYAAAVGQLVDDYPTLYGACRRALVKEKEYLSGRFLGDGEMASVRVTIRAVIERI